MKIRKNQQYSPLLRPNKYSAKDVRLINIIGQFVFLRCRFIYEKEGVMCLIPIPPYSTSPTPLVPIIWCVLANWLVRL